MKITIKSENGQKVVDLKNDLQFNATKGEQYVFSNGFSNYVLNLKDNQESVILTFNVDGRSIKVELNGIVPLLQANTENMSNPTAIIINKDANEKDVDNIVDNNSFDGGEIIDRLEALISKPVELGNNANSNLTMITDYQTLLESLGAAAAGAEAGNGGSNGSTFNSIFSLNARSLTDIADTARWENLSESIANIPVDTGDNTGDRITIFTSITSSDVNENAESVTFNIFLSYVPQGIATTVTVNVTDQNGNVTTYIVDINADGRGILTIKTQDMDIYNDSQSLTAEIVAINGGDYEEVVFGTPVTVNITDIGAIDDVTLTLNDVSVNEGTGTATVGGSLDYAPQTTLVVTLSNGATITFGPNYVVGTVVQSTPFVIQTDDVYKDGETYTLTVASTIGGNFENLVTTDTAKVTISDTTTPVTLTLNDVSVNEGTGTATVGGSLDYAPQTTLVVTLSNGETITFGTNYVAGTVVQSTPFTIQTDDVYKDGETYTLTVASTIGGNFENLVTTDTAKVTISDTTTPVTLTLNDVSVNEGTGTATVGGSLDYAPQTTLVVTLSNGETITFGTNYVAGTVVQSTPFTIQTDDVYKDGETYTLTVASTIGGNFENLVTTDTAKVTISDTTTPVTLTLNDVSVNEGTGTATVGGSLDYAPQTTLVVTLSNGETITFGTNYVAGTVVQSTPFTIQTDDVYKDGETYTLTVASTIGGNFENLVTTDTAKVTISDTTTPVTLTLNDVSVNEGTGTATVGGSLDYAPQTTLVVTLSNGETITFGTNYVAGTVVQSTPFTIQTDDVYKDGETYTLTVASTIGGNFENLVTTDTAKVTISDTTTPVTLTLNDVSVNEGTGTATVGGSLDYAPQTTLVVTLSNGETITFGTNYVAGTVVQSTPFTIQTDDVYKDGETYTLTVASTIGGNFENLVTTDTAKVTISDTTTPVTLTLNDVSVNEGTGTATVGGSLDYAPQTTLVVTLSNGETITFGTNYVAGTVVQSTPFTIQTDDVYKDGETYTLTVASTIGGNFENLVTTDTAKVTISDTTTPVTLTLNDVSVNEGTGTATVGGSLDYAPQTTLVVTLSNGETITFGTNYVAGTVVQSTPFTIQTDDVYKDGETYTLTVASTIGGNFENLVTTDTAKVTISDTTTPVTLTLNDVSVNEGTGTATVGGSLDYAPQTTLVVTLSNGETITFGTNYVAGTVVQSTPFTIQTDDVYKDGETYTLTVASTIGGNFENLVTTDTAKVTISDTTTPVTLTLNDVSVNEGTGTATVGGSLDYAPQTTLVVTLSNGETITFGTNYVAGTVVQSTPFTIQTDDVYKDGETYTLTVASTIGGNFENLVTTDTAKVTISDTTTPVTLTLNDVSVNEGTGTATVGGSLDYAPQTTLVVTLSNGETITFGTNYVAGTVVQSTPFTIQTDDVYKDGETYTLTVASTIGGNFENLVTTDTAKVTISDTTTPVTLTLNDVSVNEGTGTATVGGSLDYAPQTALIVTLSNGATITFGTDYVAGTIVQSTPFVIQADDVYKDGETYTISVTGTIGGNFENLVTTDTSKVIISDTTDATTLTLNDVSVNEGTGTATVGGSLDYAPQTALIVTLSNGATITFGTDYVAGTIVQSTPFVIQADDVYKDGETYTISVTGTIGGNFENLVTTDTSKVIISDTTDATTLTLNDVSVNEGTGTATVGGSLDYAPQTALIVTLSNGATITFGTDYVAGTIVQSTPFVIQADDVYKDGETYTISVTGTIGGNFENLVTTDTSKVIISDTTDATTLTLNDVSVNEGTGTATVGGSLDYAPQTALIVTLSNGATITFGTDYVAGTIVQSTPFVIQADDVYKDGETYTISVTGTIGGNFENLVTTDTSKVIISDTTDATTLTLNDVSVNEGTGTATVGGSLDYAPQTALIVTLSNGATITFGTDYVAGTIVQSTPFVIQADDVYKDGETYTISVTGTIGGNFENLVTTDTSKVIISDTTDATTLTLNDVSVNEGTGTATVGGSLDYAPQTALIVTLSNGATITFGTDYVAGTIVQSTPFVIQADDVYKDGETYTISVTGTIGGNFENLVTTDTSKVIISDTTDATTLTLNDVSVNEGTGTATVGGSLDYAPQTALIVTLSNGATITFGTDYVAGTIVQSTPFVIQADDVYKDGETYTISVTGTIGGNFENLVTTDTSKVIISDTTDATTLTLNDVSVNEGTGTATVGGSLDYAPQTALIVTLSNGATITFGTNYVVGTIVQSTPFIVQGEDVYVDGETYTISVIGTTGGNFENIIVTDTATVTVNDTTTTGTAITLSDTTVDEGGTATIGVSVNADTKVDLVVTLDVKDVNGNNIQVTIPAGTTANTVITSPAFVINNGEDVYVDGSSFIVSVIGTNNDVTKANNFEALTTTDTATVTVNDTTTTGTAITLSDTTVDEGGTATIGVSVNADTKVDLVVTLDVKDVNGNNIQVTIPAGTTANTVITSPAFVINNGEDVYVDGSSFIVSVIGTNNDVTKANNFEALTTTDTATVTVNDTTTTGTAITLSDTTVDEGGTATIGVSVNADTKVDLVVTLDVKDVNGNNIQVTIPAGTTANTVITSPAFVINNGEDVYVDGSSFIVSVIGTNNDVTKANNFEALTTTDTATVTVNDTTTTGTAITLSDTTVDEGGTATIGVSVNADTKVDLVVTLDVKDVNGNNIQVTIPAGTTANTVITSPAFVINNGEDVYVDGSSFIVSVIGTNNDVTKANNFEALTTTDTATVTVNDTTTTGTAITLSDTTVDEGGTATIGVSVNADTKVDLVVTLDVKDVNGNNIQVTIPAGTTANTVITSPAFVINNGEDVYVDGSSFIVSVIGTNNDVTKANNFEALTTTDTATVTVNDTTTTGTAITLSDTTVDEGGTATIGVSVNADTKVDLVVTLDVKDVNGNNIQVTIPAGTTANTVITSPAFVINNGEDVYVDGSSFIVSVIGTNNDVTKANNFEALTTTDTATVTVNDTTTTGTAITLSDTTVDEGGTATIGVSVNADTKVDLVVTLDVKDVNGNNIQVTIPAGTTANTVITSPAFVINNGEDVYVDGSSFIVSVIGTNNDVTKANNFEALTTTDTATVTVNDTTTTGTAITLSDTTVDEGGTATIGVSVNADTKVDLVVTLDVKDVNGNNIQVTIPAGTTANTVITSPAFVINNGEDVYVDGSSFIVSVTGTSNDATQKDNFEALDTSDKGTVTVNDTTNIVYVDVTASSTNLIEGAGVTYTVTLRNQDGLEVKNHGGLNITLSNGVEITIPARQDSATSSEVKAPLGSNTIKVQTIVETATADSGKQFEAIQSGKTVTVNASSSTLKNDTAIATENGSENIASEDSLDTNDGQTASGNVLSNDTVNNNTKVSKITFERNETIVKSYGNTEIVGKYGTLTINSTGKFTYKVNDDNSDVDALNVDDKLAEYFTYTTSDEKAAVLTVEVEGRNDAPIISKIETNGVTLTGIYNDYRSDNISEKVTAKDLIENDGSNSYQFKNENNTLKMDLGTTKTNVDISYEGKNAANKSILGYYEKNADGTIGNLKIIFVDGSDTSAKSIQGITGEIGFFLIPNGANNTNIMNIINGGNYQVERTEDGKIIFSSNGKLATASDVYYTDESLSTEKKDHTIALESDNQNSIIIGFEDQSLKDGSTDFDYNDFVISVKFTPSESLTNKLFKNVDFSDVDDDSLSEATVTLTNAIDGDKINIAGDLKEGITYTTEYKDGKLIIKFSGIASHEAYEEALEAIRFSTKNSENERELKFEIEIKDPNGKTDKNSVVIIGKGFDNDTPTIGDERVETKEDISYTFSIKDFGSYKDIDGDSIETIKIVTLPDPKTEGTLKYDGVVITAGKEILVKDLGKLVFEPVSNSDKDASFTFQVSDSRGAYSDIKTMTVGVEAVADAPMVSIDITKIGATIIVVDGDTGNSNNDGNNSIGGIVTENFWKGYSTKEDIMTNSTHNENSIGWQNPFTQNSDNVDINGNQTQWIDTQDGNDNVYISGNAGGMNTGNGDDKVFIKGDATNNINLGSGNDELHIKGNSSTIDAGDGDDKVKIEGNANNDIQLGAGNDSLEIKGNSNGTIELGNGNNYLEIKGNATSIQVGGDSRNDRVIVNGNATNNISLGKGDDYLELGGKILNYVDGGEGNNDSVYLKGYTLSEYQALIANGNEWRVQNFENIKLGDGSIVKGDGSVFDDTTTVYKYDISLSAQLTDGSEKLSDVTLKNIPEGSKLFGADGKEINANDNGTYTVKVDENGEAKLSLTNEKEVSDTDLNSIQTSATSTDTPTDGKEESSQATTFDGEGDIDLTSIIGQYKVNYIDLENGKANDIELNFDEILADDKEIYIKGDDKDSISLNSELWKEAESIKGEDGVKYNVYTGTNSAANSTIKLLIDDDIQVNHDI